MESSGKNTPQYESVRVSYDSLIDFLRNNQRAKQDLFNKFVTKNWIDTGDCPNENVLINIAMDRIKNKSTEYNAFLSILKQISGTSHILDKLKGASPEPEPQPEPNPGKEFHITSLSLSFHSLFLYFFHYLPLTLSLSHSLSLFLQISFTLSSSSLFLFLSLSLSLILSPSLPPSLLPSLSHSL